MRELVVGVLAFTQETTPKASHLSDELADRVAGLRREVDAWKANFEIRRALAYMCKHFVSVLGKARTTGEVAFKEVAKGTDGFMHDIFAMASLQNMSAVSNMKYSPALDHLDEGVLIVVSLDESGFTAVTPIAELAGLIESFAKGRCFEQLFKVHLVSPVGEADASFFDTTLGTLRGLSMADLASPLEGLSAADALAKMVNMELMQQIATAAASDHDWEQQVDPSVVRNDLEVSALSSALVRWVDLSGIAELPTKLSLDPAPWPSADLESAVRAFAHVCQATSFACLMCVNFAGDIGSMLTNTDVDGKQASVVNVNIGRMYSELCTHLEAWPIIRDKFISAPSHTRASFLVQALDSLMQFLVRFACHLKHCMYHNLSELLSQRIKELNALVPAWSHVVSHKQYNAGLASKQLLNPTMQANLENCMVATFHLTSSISRLYSEWGEDALLDDHPQITEAEAALDHTRNTMTIIAAVGIIEMSAGAMSQSDRAAKIAKLLKAKCIPDALRAKLKEVAA